LERRFSTQYTNKNEPKEENQYLPDLKPNINLSIPKINESRLTVMNSTAMNMKKATKGITDKNTRHKAKNSSNFLNIRK